MALMQLHAAVSNSFHYDTSHGLQQAMTDEVAKIYCYI
jgi:hypothetical protein